MVEKLDAPQTVKVVEGEIPDGLIGVDIGPKTIALYGGVMGRAIEPLSALLVRIGEGRWDDTEARLKALAIMGQALVFRVGRATLLRAAGWTDVDAEGSAAIRRVVLTQTSAVLTDRGEGVPR